MQKEKKRILIGKIDKLFKLNGEVKVLPLTYSENRFLDIKKVYIDEEEDLFLSISNVKIQENGVIIKFKEIDNIENARKFLGFYLYINKDDIKKLDKDSIYYFDLKDYQIIFNNTNLGFVKDIYEDGANCFFTFHYNSKEYIVPFNKDFVNNIDKEKKCLEINHFDLLAGNEIE